nr:uncharacterized protein LOC128703132 isoform X1 [Cherax quadricarinatus]
MDDLPKEELNGLRFIMAVNVCGRHVMYKTFRWGTPDKPDNVKLDEYLNNLKSTSTANYSKLTGKSKKFNKTQKELINKSSDGSMFDVSMLHLSIKLACENVALFDDEKWWNPSGEMEYYISAIKKVRNDVLHGQLAVTDKELFEKIIEFRELLINCLKTSGDRYMQDQNEVDIEMKKLNDDLDIIMEKTLGMEDIVTHISDDVKQLMLDESSKILKEAFQKIRYVNPVSFITDDVLLKVDDIFVDVEVKEGKRGGDGKHVNYKDLLQIVHNISAPSSQSSATLQQDPLTRPKMLLLEGLAGSGKTTLVKLVAEEWIQGSQGNLKGLDNYELLLWVQCRDHSVNSYQCLLNSLMPDVSINFKNLLPKIMNLCRIIIIIDGLDEMNTNSIKLVESLLHEYQNSSHTTFLCTSRPEKVDMFMRMIPEEYDVKNAELQGITKQLLPEFVRRTHQEISQKTKSNRSTNKLVGEVMRLSSLHEHLKLPMNLTFFIYIWDTKTDNLNTMPVTQTELYYEIHLLCQEKLKEKLVTISAKMNTMNKEDLDSKVNTILKKIYVISLKTLSIDQLTLENSTVDKLHLDCNNLGLPSDEVFSAFFNLKPIWTWRGVEEQYSAPHKGIQDYYSALHIVIALKEQSSGIPDFYNQSVPDTDTAPSLTTPDSFGKIKEVLEQTLKPVAVDMTKLVNVFVHVAGLLHLFFDQVPESFALEIVRLLRESGVKNEYRWLNILENTKMNTVTCQAIADNINTKRNIKIEDKSVGSYAALLPYIKPSKIRITLYDDPGDLPRLPELLSSLKRHHCTLFTLSHHYGYAETATTSDDILRLVQPRDQLEEFTGLLSGDGVALLPPSLKQLRLAVVSDDHACHFLSLLHAAISSSLPRLTQLTYNVSPEVSAASVKTDESLPSRVKVHLRMKDMTNDAVSRVCDLAQELQPPDGYYSLEFPGAILTEEGWRHFVESLDHSGVKVREEIKVPDSTRLTNSQFVELAKLVDKTLRCKIWDGARIDEFLDEMLEMEKEAWK